MITIKLNGKNKTIKTYRELTLREYIEVLEDVKSKENYSIFDYIAKQTGYTFEKLQLQKLSGIELLSNELGTIKIIRGDSELDFEAIENQPLKKIMSFDGRLYDLSKVKMKSKVGYRIVIEQFIQTKPNYIDLYVHTIAAVLNYEKNINFDYDTIRDIANDLQEYNAYTVLGNGAFFFFNLINGDKIGEKFLTVCRNILTAMKH